MTQTHLDTQSFSVFHENYVTSRSLYQNVPRVHNANDAEQYVFTKSTLLHDHAIKMFHVFIMQMMQRPHKRSKARDHVKYLGKSLMWWKRGDIDLMFNEALAIQGELLLPKHQQ